MYNPSVDPTTGKNEQELEDIASAYMHMWYGIDEELDNALDTGDLFSAGIYLIGAGAIDSRLCYPTCQNIELYIESLVKP